MTDSADGEGAEGIRQPAAAFVTFPGNGRGGEVPTNPSPVPGPSEMPKPSEEPEPEIHEPSETPESSETIESDDGDQPGHEEPELDGESAEPDDAPKTGDPAHEALRQMPTAFSLPGGLPAVHAVNRRTKKTAK